MKKIWNFLIDWAETIQRARTATYLTRAGRHAEAQKVFEK